MLNRRSGAETTGARETPAVATYSVRPDQPERPPLAVSDADVRAGWYAWFNPALGAAVREPNPHDVLDQMSLAGIRRVIEHDRARVASLPPEETPQ